MKTTSFLPFTLNTAKHVQRFVLMRFGHVFPMLFLFDKFLFDLRRDQRGFHVNVHGRFKAVFGIVVLEPDSHGWQVGVVGQKRTDFGGGMFFDRHHMTHRRRRFRVARCLVRNFFRHSARNPARNPSGGFPSKVNAEFATEVTAEFTTGSSFCWG